MARRGSGERTPHHDMEDTLTQAIVENSTDARQDLAAQGLKCRLEGVEHQDQED